MDLVHVASSQGPKECTVIRDCTVIREIYEHESSQEEFEVELDQALEAGVKTIVIEPSKLGDEAARWIMCGNCLHKTAVLSGVGSLVCAGVWPDRGEFFMPLGFVSVMCAGVYAISWQFDPCCKYQVETNMNKVPKLPLHSLTTTTPVILVRKDDSRRKFLHNTVSLIAGAVCAYKLYKWYFV
ncbi:hypothetical protein BaRGS_00000963 [Batillaria attramentaria]|uniref:Transmembrane protein 11 n=1 Tax=Batillaria attramentaria TaxID=370345 RepID=A0ABD0M848_9CAEN